MSIDETELAGLIETYKKKKRLFELFLDSVESSFVTDAALNTGTPTVIHSVRKRLKDEDHLKEKIRRKVAEGRVINNGNLFSEITDLAGLRILHLHQAQAEQINAFIRGKVRRRSWKLVEPPVAYTWDPESNEFFKRLRIKTKLKPSYYTSVHYLLSPSNNEERDVVCEVQVRTLFEEAWGEIDHSINYPDATKDVANLEQLRVLSRLVSTGSRLADSIFKIHNLRGEEA